MTITSELKVCDSWIAADGTEIRIAREGERWVVQLLDAGSTLMRRPDGTKVEPEWTTVGTDVADSIAAEYAAVCREASKLHSEGRTGGPLRAWAVGKPETHDPEVIDGAYVLVMAATADEAAAPWIRRGREVIALPADANAFHAADLETLAAADDKTSDDDHILDVFGHDGIAPLELCTGRVVVPDGGRQLLDWLTALGVATYALPIEALGS